MRPAKDALPDWPLSQFAPLHFGDGRHYDLHLGSYAGDRDFYIRSARAGQKVLELGAGTGRITIPMAELGCAVTGIELLPGMMSVAKEKARAKGISIEWISGDFLDCPLRGGFDLMIAPFNFIAQFPRSRLPEVLRRVAGLMAPSGTLAFDVLNPDWIDSPANAPIQVSYENPDGGRVGLEITCRREGDRIRVRHQYRLPDGGSHKDEFFLAALPARELEAALLDAGLTVAAKFGNFKEKPYGDADAQQIVICRKNC